MTVEETIFEQYRGKSILLDSNLLLLWMVGSYQRARIATFKRTADFTAQDYDVLVSILRQFRAMMTTPHILTEVSNLANSLPEHLKATWWIHFADQLATLTEVREPAADLTRETCFNPLGLADAAVQKASVDTRILTDDFRLAGFLKLQGMGVLNFRHLRQTL